MPVHAGVADVIAPAQRTDLVAGFGGFTDHPVPEGAGRAGDQNGRVIAERAYAPTKENGHLRRAQVPVDYKRYPDGPGSTGSGPSGALGPLRTPPGPRCYL